MKRFVFILLCVSIPVLSFSQPMSIRKAFAKYGHEEGITKISMPGIVMDFAALFVDDHETARLLRGINKIKILASDEDSDRPVKGFAAEVINDFHSRAFNELMTVKSEGDNVAIYMKEGKRNKKELLIIAGGKEESAIVYIKGKIDPSMLNKLGSEMKINSLKAI